MTDPPHGTATINPDQTVRYVPDPDYAGADAFTYDVKDSRGGNGRATVRVTVTDVPEPPPPSVTMQSPLSMWGNASSPGYDGMGFWFVAINEPRMAPGRSPPAYAYNHRAWFADGASSANLSLSIGPEGKRATFAVQKADGTTKKVQVPMEWKAGKAYFLYMYHLGGSQWGAWVVDGTTGALTTIGAIAVAPHTKLFSATMTSTNWMGAPAPTCAAYPRSQSMVLAPIGYVGAQMSSAASARPIVMGTGCPATVGAFGPWTVYGVGQP